MRRRGLNTICLLSLLICLGCIVVWALSFHVQRGVIFTTHAGNCLEASTEPGGMNFDYVSNSRFTGYFYPPFKPLDDGWSCQAFAYDQTYSAPAFPSQPAVNSPYSTHNTTRVAFRLRVPAGRWGHLAHEDRVMTYPAGLIPGATQSHLIRVSAPLWLIMLLTGVPLVLRAILVRRRSRRIRRGQCLTCGYNLTANTSGVCPECGTAIANHEW